MTHSQRNALGYETHKMKGWINTITIILYRNVRISQKLLLTLAASWHSLTPTFSTFRELALFILRENKKERVKKLDIILRANTCRLRTWSLPRSPRRGILRSDSFQLPDQLLAAPAYWLAELGEWAAALQTAQPILHGALLFRVGPDVPHITWDTNITEDAYQWHHAVQLVIYSTNLRYIFNSNTYTVFGSKCYWI